MRVREALAIGVIGPRSREPFEYDVQHLPPRRRGKRAHMRRADLDARLAPFDADLRAGVPDAFVARRAGLTTEQVKGYRHRQRMLRKNTRQPGWRRHLAMDFYGDAQPIPMTVRSPVGGTWEPPEYVLRQPLDYTALVRVVHAATSAGLSALTIAAGLGLRVADIEAASALSTRL